MLVLHPKKSVRVLDRLVPRTPGKSLCSRSSYLRLPCQIHKICKSLSNKHLVALTQSNVTEISQKWEIHPEFGRKIVEERSPLPQLCALNAVHTASKILDQSSGPPPLSSTPMDSIGQMAKNQVSRDQNSATLPQYGEAPKYLTHQLNNASPKIFPDSEICASSHLAAPDTASSLPASYIERR